MFILKELNLSINKIEGMVSIKSGQLRQLQKLDLSHNKISHFSLCGSVKLITLYLQNNQISRADLIELNNLESLYLDSNLISSLSKENLLMVNLTRLKWLGLQQNIISTIDFVCLSQLTSLAYLDLSGNKITSFHLDSFKFYLNHLKNVRI
jgi:Leucine-rich repeat (LRR) protein